MDPLGVTFSAKGGELFSSFHSYDGRVNAMAGVRISVAVNSSWLGLGKLGMLNRDEARDKDGFAGNGEYEAWRELGPLPATACSW